MIEIIKHAAIINAFWFSLPLIGYAILLFFRDGKISSYLGYWSQIILKQHIFVSFVVSFTIAYFIFALLSLPLYIFHSPVIVPVLVYVVLLFLSTAYLLVLFAKRLFKTNNTNLLLLKDQTMLVRTLLIGVCFVIAIDFLLTIFVAKAYPWGDGVYHMARVVSIINDGFNVQTSYFNNIPESGYIYNAVFTLYAIPSVLFHLDPMKVWEYSLGFFRLLLWLSIFTLASAVFRYSLKVKESWLLFSGLSTIAAIAINAGGFFVANYPSRLVVVWLILLAILLAYSSKKVSRSVNPLIITVSFILVMTHMVYAVVAACFMALLIVVKLLVLGKASLPRSRLIALLISVGILLSIPLASKLLPVRASDDLIHLKEAPTISVLGMKMLAPDLPASLLDAAVLAVWIIGVVVALVILWRSKSRQEFAVLLTASLFYPVLVYVPIVFTVLNHFLPIWVIQRFASANVFEFIGFGLGMYSLYIGIIALKRKYLKSIPKSTVYSAAAIIVVIVMLLMSGILAKQTYADLLKDRKDKQTEYQTLERTTQSFRNILKDNKLVVTTPTYSYIFTSLFNVDILAVEYGHSPLASDGANRSLCQEYILKNVRYNELNAIGANYIIGFVWDKEDIGATRPYLKLVGQNQDFRVYEVLKNYKGGDTGSVYEPCLKFQQIEK